MNNHKEIGLIIISLSVTALFIMILLGIIFDSEAIITLVVYCCFIQFIFIPVGLILFFLKVKSDKDKRIEQQNYLNVMEEKRLYERQKLDREEEIKNIEKQKIIDKAKNFEIAERFEDAIKIYEDLEMWKDAGRVRRIKREIEMEKKEIITKHIHLNANELFDQIKIEGLSVPYKCPNCSGVLKITGHKIETCPYCNSNLDLDTLSSLVKTMLS